MPITNHPSSISVMVEIRATGMAAWTHDMPPRVKQARYDGRLSALFGPASSSPRTRLPKGPHLRDFPRPRRGPKQASDSTAEEARDPVMALHPKWCPTTLLGLTLHCGVVDDSQSNIICKHGNTSRSRKWLYRKGEKRASRQRLRIQSTIAITRARKTKRRFPFGEDVPHGLGAYPPFGRDSLAMIGSGNTLLRFYRKRKIRD